MVGVDRRLLQNVDWTILVTALALGRHECRDAHESARRTAWAAPSSGASSPGSAWALVALLAVASLDYRRLVGAAPPSTRLGLAALVTVLVHRADGVRCPALDRRGIVHRPALGNVQGRVCPHGGLGAHLARGPNEWSRGPGPDPGGPGRSVRPDREAARPRHRPRALARRARPAAGRGVVPPAGGRAAGGRARGDAGGVVRHEGLSAGTHHGVPGSRARPLGERLQRDPGEDRDWLGSAPGQGRGGGHAEPPVLSPGASYGFHLRRIRRDVGVRRLSPAPRLLCRPPRAGFRHRGRRPASPWDVWWRWGRPPSSPRRS